MTTHLETFDHVVIGAGIAGSAAVRGIRSRDTSATVLVVDPDPDAPCSRPALSKTLWRDADATVESIRLHDIDAATEVRVTRATTLDTAARTVTLSDGSTVGYGTLVLTGGGEPRTLEAPASDRVVYFRDLDDYRRLRALADQGKHVVVVGGGFIGTELAAALRGVGAQVTLVHGGAHVGDAVYPEQISAHLDAVYREQGVALRPGSRVASVVDDGSGVQVTLTSGEQVAADGVVLGLGVVPRTGLASAAGLAVADGGVVVDDRMRTSDPAVFAAGDVVAYPDPVFGRRRVEHEDAANTQGELAGRNAAGADEVYDHVPFFYSDLFDDGYEALGRLDARLTTVLDWKTPGSEAVVYYLDEDSVLQGVLLWNVWGDDDHDTKAIARTLLDDRTPQQAENLVGRI